VQETPESGVWQKTAGQSAPKVHVQIGRFSVKVSTAAAYIFGIQHFFGGYRRAEASRQQCSQSTHSRRTEEIHDQQRTPKNRRLVQRRDCTLESKRCKPT